MDSIADEQIISINEIPSVPNLVIKHYLNACQFHLKTKLDSLYKGTRYEILISILSWFSEISLNPLEAVIMSNKDNGYYGKISSWEISIRNLIGGKFADRFVWSVEEVRSNILILVKDKSISFEDPLIKQIITNMPDLDCNQLIELSALYGLSSSTVDPFFTEDKIDKNI